MSNAHKYFVVEADVLPKVFIKVVAANTFLKTGEAKTASEAALMAGISRSVFYKYKDAVRPYYDKAQDRIITFYAMLMDNPGVLSSFLSKLAKAGANILTINQNIPVNSIAPITVSAQTGALKTNLDKLISTLSKTEGVVSVDIIAY